MYKKPFALGVILLFLLSTLQSYTGENIKPIEEQSENNFLQNKNINVTVHGFIVDESNATPITNAYVYAIIPKIEGNNENYTLIGTYTNHTGWYELIIPHGTVLMIYVRAQKYFMNFTNIYFPISEIIWLNFSLKKGRALETSTIQGYITDNRTQNKLNKALVVILWKDEQNNIDINYTYTNQNGFYKVNMTNGLIIIVVFYSEFFHFQSSEFWIDAWSTRWFNLSMTPLPEENAITCGYIYDSEILEPIENVSIDLNWRRDNTTYYGYPSFDNSTFTDSNGYYMMKTAQGVIDLICYHKNYSYYHFSYYDIGDNETFWLNISLEPKYYNYFYKWTKKTGNYSFSDLFVSKKESYIDDFLVSVEQGDVLTSVEVNVNWIDDFTYGLLFTKGKDVLTVNISHNDDVFIETSTHAGNHFFLFFANDIPSDGMVSARNLEQADELIREEFRDMNNASFDVVIDIDIGEKIWRVLKYLRDKGNSFEMDYEYSYYEYSIEEN